MRSISIDIIFLREGGAVEKKKPNWIKIRTEYETTNTSYQKLSEKYGVSINTLRPRAVREGWTKSKRETSIKIAHRTHQKVSEKISTNMAKELEATELINDIILEALRDKKQFYKHLVQKKEKFAFPQHDESDGTIDPVIERNWTESQEFDVLDSKRLKEISDTLGKSTTVKRLLTNVIDADKQAKIDIDREKLDIEKKKQEEVDKQDKEIRIVLEGSMEDWSG